MLENIVASLHAAQWYERRGREWGDSEGAIFPDESKTWMRGKQPPNCLGMIQMLVGFARATGERHLAVTPLVPTDYLTARFQIFGLRRLIECLEPHSDLAPVRRKLRQWRRQLHEWCRLLPVYDQRNGQAHHALLLRAKGRRWYYVDPYFRTLSVLAAEERPNLWRTMNGILRRVPYSVNGVSLGLDSFSEVAADRLGIDRTVELLEAVVQCIRTPREAQRILVDADMGSWFSPLVYKRSREYSAYYAHWLDLGDICLIDETDMTSELPPAMEVGHSETVLATFVMNHITVLEQRSDVNVSTALASQYIIKDQKALGVKPDIDDDWYTCLPSWAILPSLREQALLTKPAE